MPTQELRVVKKNLVVGRSPDNDLVIDHPMVSSRHARLTWSERGYVLQDLGTPNGTFVNGVRLVGPVLIRRTDTVQIGPARMRFTGRGRYESDDLRLSTRLDVKNVNFEVKRGSRRLQLLHDISLTINPGELVALMGPAGAGKTTLMENMNGNMRPTAGAVLLNGLDLHRHYDAMRGHIGYVPQDDIVHRKLTVYQSCYYTAKMRMRLRGHGGEEQALHDRVVEVLRDLDLLHKANTIVGGPNERVLSGGQRKRLNLGMELVTDPAILFLDEPTSGLSSSDAKSVMEVLKRLSEKGRTIIITIHQPSREIYEMMDNSLILSVGGGLIYYGPVTGAYRCFGTAPNPDALFEALTPKEMDRSDWTALEEAYAKTAWHKEFVTERADDRPTGEDQAPRPRATRAIGIRQFLLLFERLSKLYTKDFGWLFGAVFGAPLLMFFLTTQLGDVNSRHTLMFIATLLAYFFGIFPAIEMIHGERAIYSRERMVNLKIPSYVLSKVLLLLAFGMLQAFSIAAILVWYEEVDGPFAPVFALVLSVQFTGVAAGLFISTLSSSTKAAMLMMLACVILMIAFSGFVVRLPQLREDGTTWLLAPSSMRWGLGGLLDVVADVPGIKVKFLGFHNEVWQLNVLVNAALALLPIGATMLILRLRDKV